MQIPIVFVFLLIALSGCLPVGAQAQGPADSAGFTVQLTPDPVYPSCNSGASSPYYLWPFEARVTNNFEFPIRIKEFSALTSRAGAWISSQAPFGATEFTEWYTGGDPVDDGWIQPGTTAIDPSSWNRSYVPVNDRVKWYYIAEDEQGNEFRAEQEPALIPYVSDNPNWESQQSFARADLRVTVIGADGKAPEYAQIRFGRFPGRRSAYAVYETKDGIAETTVPLPGLYLLEVYVPGYDLVSIPLVLEDGLTNTQLSIVLPANGSTDLATVEYVDASANAAVEFYREWKKACEDYYEASKVHREKHMTSEGFEYDLAALGDKLKTHYRNNARPALARFAGFLVFNTPFKFEDTEIEYLLNLLPADSFVWAAGPDFIANAAFQSGRYKEVLEEVASRNPDSLVRAKALISLAHSAKGEYDNERLNKLLDQLRVEYAKLDGVSQQIVYLEKADRLFKGGPVPEFDLPTLEDGVRISTTDLKGSYYLLHFWATWCGPCMAEMEFVHAAHKTYSDSGLRFVSISLDRKREAIKKCRSLRWKIPWTNVFSGDDPEYEQRFGISSIPALFLVNPDGVIVEATNDLRGEKLMDTLGKHVKIPSLE